MTSYARQTRYQVRLDWGLSGLAAITQDDPTVIVVDVLSFSTAVSVALSKGAAVLPYPWTDDRAPEYARRHGAMLAAPRGTSAYSLSPASLRGLPLGSRIVLPSLNGATICFGSSGSRVLAGCLRNRTSVIELAQSCPRPIAVIAAGERWPDGSLRPSLEDLLGAGAIISALSVSGHPDLRPDGEERRAARLALHRSPVKRSSLPARSLVKSAASIPLSPSAPSGSCQLRLRAAVTGSSYAPVAIAAANSPSADVAMEGVDTAVPSARELHADSA
jgi:2-phosphosulfolactate phosphatase